MKNLLTIKSICVIIIGEKGHSFKAVAPSKES